MQFYGRRINDMPGVTKHIYDAEIQEINKMWKKQLSEISKILPRCYSGEDVQALLVKFYPHEWKSVEYKKRYYDSKDKFLLKRFGKKRYNMPSPGTLLQNNTTYKKILSSEYKRKYSEFYCQENQLQAEQELMKRRLPKIERINRKIENAKYLTQSVTPDFLDKIIGLYERKSTSQKDKVYLLIELKKYYNDKVISFFFKLNDTELNKQLRQMAFMHLQSFNYQPRLRKQKYMQIHAKNKKRKEYLQKVYPNLKYDVPETPKELVNRISISKEQDIKQYDCFISHSSSNQEMVRTLIAYLNEAGLFVFCDWMNDSDYLKRELLCEETLKVIRYRLEKSKALLFVRTPQSLNSIWCKYEINYYYSLKKPMYVIQGDSLENGIFEITEYVPKELLDEKYEQLLFL